MGTSVHLLMSLFLLSNHSMTLTGILNPKIVSKMPIPAYVDGLLPSNTHPVYLSFLNTAIHHALHDKQSPITLKKELERVFLNLSMSNHFARVWMHLEESVLVDLIKE